jgi:hypothetical protein
MKIYLPILDPKEPIAWNDVHSLKAVSDRWVEVSRLNEHWGLQIHLLAQLIASKPDYEKKSLNLLVLAHK